MCWFLCELPPWCRVDIWTSLRFAGNSRKTFVCVSKGLLSGGNRMIVGGVGLTTVDPTERHEVERLQEEIWHVELQSRCLSEQRFSKLVNRLDGRLPGTRGPLVLVGFCWAAVVVSGGFCWLPEIIIFPQQQKINKQTAVISVLRREETSHLPLWFWKETR